MSGRTCIRNPKIECPRIGVYGDCEGCIIRSPDDFKEYIEQAKKQTSKTVRLVKHINRYSSDTLQKDINQWLKVHSDAHILSIQYSTTPTQNYREHYIIYSVFIYYESTEEDY